MATTRTDPAPSPVSDWLRDAIAASGLSTYAVARAAGLRVQILSRWLSGERDLRLDTVDKVANALGLRPGQKIPEKK